MSIHPTGKTRFWYLKSGQRQWVFLTKMFINRVIMNNCSICKSSTGNIISGSKCYCEMCWYHENPPVLVLTKTWERSQLFNPKLDKYIYLTSNFISNQIKNCGFILFNKKVFFNQQVNQKYREILVYKYSGNLRCLAVKEYKAWPTKMPNCNKIGCAVR